MTHPLDISQGARWQGAGVRRQESLMTAKALVCNLTQSTFIIIDVPTYAHIYTHTVLFHLAFSFPPKDTNFSERRSDRSIFHLMLCQVEVRSLKLPRGLPRGLPGRAPTATCPGSLTQSSSEQSGRDLNWHFSTEC